MTVRLAPARQLIKKFSGKRDPEKVTVLKRDHVVTDVRKDIQHLVALQSFPQIALWVAALVGVTPVHREGLVEVLVQ